MLKHYDQLLDAVNRNGLVFLSGHPAGMPSVSAMTAQAQWHTGLEDDPWLWKDRAAARRDCAYLHVGGRPALVSLAVLPVLLAAKRYPGGPDALYQDGKLERTAYLIWQQLQSGMPRAVHELKGALGVGKQGQSAFSRCLVLLQDLGWAAAAGSVRKRSAGGAEYGWPVCVYQAIDAMFPQLVLPQNRAPAADALLHLAMGLAPGLTRVQARRVLGLRA